MGIPLHVGQHCKFVVLKALYFIDVLYNTKQCWIINLILQSGHKINIELASTHMHTAIISMYIVYTDRYPTNFPSNVSG